MITIMRKKIYISISGNLSAFMVHKEMEKVRAKPLCEISSHLLELTGKKSFNWDDLSIIQQLGYKIMVVEHFDGIKLTTPIQNCLTFPGL